MIREPNVRRFDAIHVISKAYVEGTTGIHIGLTMMLYPPLVFPTRYLFAKVYV